MATRWAFWEASRARRWRVLRPRWASQQSNAEGTAPIAFCRNVRRVLSSRELKAQAPIRTSWDSVSCVDLWLGVEEMKAYGVAVYVLRNRVNDNICAVIKGILDVGTQECIVHYNHYAVLMCYRRHSSYINQFQRRIARSLDPYQLRLIGPYLACYIEFDAWCKRDLHAVGCCHLCKVSVRAPVDVRYGDDVRACGK